MLFFLIVLHHSLRNTYHIYIVLMYEVGKYPKHSRSEYSAAFSKASARERSPTKQYLLRHFLLFSRRTFAGARFAERSTGVVAVSQTYPKSIVDGYV